METTVMEQNTEQTPVKKPLKKIVAENLTELRKKKGLTQIQLAQEFNYSDKAVSKWECGDTTPDIETLQSLADFYGVTLDYLTHPLGEAKQNMVLEKKMGRTSKPIISLLSCLIPVFVATMVFIVLLALGKMEYAWLSFLWCVPVVCILLFIFAWIWWSKTIRSAFGIVMTWALLIACYIQLGVSVSNGWKLWELLLIGLPITLAMVLWCKVKKPAEGN